MNRIMSKRDLAHELYRRTKTFKRQVKPSRREVGFRYCILKREAAWLIDILEDIIIENMCSATHDERSAVELCEGFIIGGYRVPDRQMKDPRNGNAIIAKERVVPYSTFSDAFKRRIRKLTEVPNCTSD